MARELHWQFGYRVPALRVLGLHARAAHLPLQAAPGGGGAGRARVDPLTRGPRTKDRRLRISGELPMGLGTPPLKTKSLLEPSL